MLEFTLVGKEQDFGPLPELLEREVRIHFRPHEEFRPGGEGVFILSLRDPATIATLSRGHLFQGAIIVLWGPRELIDQHQSLLEEKSCVAGILEEGLSPQEIFTQLRSLGKLSRYFHAAQQLPSLGREVSQLAKSVAYSSEKLKEIHKKFISMRKLEHKGVRALSAFAVGVEEGGEFYDVFLSPQKKFLSLIMTSTSSYLMSCQMLKTPAILKGEGDFDERVGQCLEVLQPDMKMFAPEGGCSFFYLSLKLSSMWVQGVHFGGGGLYAGGKVIDSPRNLPLEKGFLERSKLGFQLRRGERFFMASAGFESLCREKKIHVPDLLKGGASGEEIISEAFFQLKKNRPGKFLKRDVALVSVEVLKNAIFEV